MQFHDQAFGGTRQIILQCFEGGEGQGTKSKIHGMLDTADKNVLIGFNDVVQL